MKTTTVKVREATGAALDWMVYHAESRLWLAYANALRAGTELPARPSEYVQDYEFDPYEFQPSSDWSDGGPIVEREGLWVRETAVVSPAIAHLTTPDKKWFGYAKLYPQGCVHHCLHGARFLVAAMRCYVASQLGDEVEVPKEWL